MFTGAYKNLTNQIWFYREVWDASKLQSNAQKNNLEVPWQMPPLKSGMTEAELEESEELKELFLTITRNPAEVYDSVETKVVRNYSDVRLRTFIWVDSRYDYETMQRMGIGTEYDEELKEKLSQEYVDTDIVEKVPVEFEV